MSKTKLKNRLTEIISNLAYYGSQPKEPVIKEMEKIVDEELTSLRLDGDKEFEGKETLIEKLRIAADEDNLDKMPELDMDEAEYLLKLLSLSSDEKGVTDNFNSEEEILP